MYLLDTNTISNIARDPNGVAAERYQSKMPSEVGTSIIVSSEVLFGLQNKEGHRLHGMMMAMLESLTIFNLEQPVDRKYAELRAHLKAEGRPIGPNDLFIAAHALALDATLVTDNTSEFSRVPGLKVENWLHAQP